jgi:hypothetical protein
MSLDPSQDPMEMETFQASFLIHSENASGRLALLVTLFLVQGPYSQHFIFFVTFE